MNDELEPIAMRFRRNFERTLLACWRCKTVAKTPGETEDQLFERAWTFGEYVIEPWTINAIALLLIIPCEDHILLSPEAHNVEAQLMASGYNREV